MFLTYFDKEAKLWYGRKALPLYNPKISMAQAFLKAMDVFGHRIAQISDDDGYEMTYDETKMKIVRAAQNLQALGLKPKQVCGLMGRNSRNVAPITVASIAIGCPVNTIDPSFSKAELLHMLKLTKPALMFCDKACYKLLKTCLDELENRAKIFTFGDVEGESESVESLFRTTFKESEFTPVNVDGENDTAVIICSSGTTSLPKGVCVSHAAVLNGFSQSSRSRIDNIHLCYISIHGLNSIFILTAAVLTGATRLLVTGTFSPERQLHLIEKYKVTYMFCAPHQIVLMLDCDRFSETDLSSLKVVVVTGDRVPLHLKASLQKHIPNGFFCTVMGMSELACSIAVDYPPSDKDTIGKLGDGNCVKIVDDDGNRCGVNVDGELCIKTNARFIGYYGDEQATKEVIDEEGFFKTGDIVHIDEDGYMYVVDRKKNLLKYYTNQISPTAIDLFLSESPAIKAACTVGIPDPDGMGDLVAAVVIRAEGSNISEQEIYDMVAEQFSDSYKLRGGVYFVDALPLTPTSKVIRRKVKEIAIELYNARGAQTS